MSNLKVVVSCSKFVHGFVRSGVTVNSRLGLIHSFASTSTPSDREKGFQKHVDSERKAGFTGLDFDHENIDPNLRRKKGKLFESLGGVGSNALKALTGTQRNQIDGIGSDICDILNEALSDVSFYKLFRGTKDASKVVDFVDTTINRDLSHVTVFWKSNIVNKFLEFVKAQRGEELHAKFEDRTKKFINKKLQDAEPRFRSLLIKDLMFKKVPRIFFVKIEDKKNRDWSSEVELLSILNERNPEAQLDAASSNDDDDVEGLFSSLMGDMDDHDGEIDPDDIYAKSKTGHPSKPTNSSAKDIPKGRLLIDDNLNDEEVEPFLRPHLMLIRTQHVKNQIQKPGDIDEYSSREEVGRAYIKRLQESASLSAAQIHSEDGDANSPKVAVHSDRSKMKMKMSLLLQAAKLNRQRSIDGLAENDLG